MAYPATVPLEAVSRRCLSNRVDYLWELEFPEPPPTEAEWKEMLAMFPPLKVGWDWEYPHRAAREEERSQQAEHEAREREKARKKKKEEEFIAKCTAESRACWRLCLRRARRQRHDCERRAGKKENGKQKMGHRRK